MLGPHERNKQNLASRISAVPTPGCSHLGNEMGHTGKMMCGLRNGTLWNFSASEERKAAPHV